MTSAAQQLRREDVVRRCDWLVAVVLGIGLTGVVWRDLLTGGGLVGGDVYPYFLPQKQVLAESLAAGDIPLWHDRTGLGYPLLAESQAGVFYPPNQVLYRLFDVHTAWHLAVLLHYAASYAFAWRFLRSQQLSQTAALFAAMVFVYGWFPARISLEWSIIGGVWFPLTLWLTDRLTAAPRLIAVAALGVAFATHLLAGHFALAFISQVTCVAYAVLRGGARSTQRRLAAGATAGGFVIAGIAVGMLLAAVQLLPTLELKTISQRSGAETPFDPAYGHLPPIYITQVLASWWYWHTPEIVRSGQFLTLLPWTHVAADSNVVECHLYPGLIPLVLCGSVLLRPIRRRLPSGQLLIWGILGAGTLVYATGWLLPVFGRLPGFSWFMGPGRWTIVTQLAAAVIAGHALDVWLRRRSVTARWLLTAVLLAAGLADVLRASAFPVRDAVIVESPPLQALSESWVRKELQRYPAASARLLLRGANVGNLYGVSSLPTYLGLGPATYLSEQQRYAAFPDADPSVFPSPEEEALLRERGVTHLLMVERIARPADSLELVRSGPDAFLNQVWARGGQPCWLYRFRDPPQRVFATDGGVLNEWTWVEDRPGCKVFDVTLAEAGTIGLRELMLPGWSVTVDGRAVAPVAAARGQTGGPARMQRLVAVESGAHRIRWTYRPRTFTIGASMSLAAAVVLAALALRSRRRSADPHRTGGAAGTTTSAGEHSQNTQDTQDEQDSRS